MMSVDIQFFAKKRSFEISGGFTQAQMQPSSASNLSTLPIQLQRRKKNLKIGFFPENQGDSLEIPWVPVFSPSSSGSKLLSHSKKAVTAWRFQPTHPPWWVPTTSPMTRRLPHLGEIHTRLGVSLELGVRCVILELGVLPDDSYHNYLIMFLDHLILN